MPKSQVQVGLEAGFFSLSQAKHACSGTTAALFTKPVLPCGCCASPSPAGDEGTNSEAAFFCDDLHQELEQLLSGGGLGAEAAASLAAAQVGGAWLERHFACARC